eukprot:13646030-Heterocapsa_arctica.AAC.1
MGGGAIRFVIRGGGRSTHQPSAALPRPAGQGRAHAASSPAGWPGAGSPVAETPLRNRAPSTTL